MSTDPVFTQLYNSREHLLTAIRTYAIAHGFAVSIHRSEAGRYIRLSCDLGGEYRDRIKAPDGAKRRITSSRLAGCGFFVYAITSKKDPEGKWCIKSFNLIHNHETKEADLIHHPAARNICLTEAQKAKIHILIELDYSPKDIIPLIYMDWPKLLITAKDISNLRQAYILKKLDGKSPMEFLLSELANQKWHVKFQTDPNGYITFLLFAHPKSIEYANKFNRVFIMDCTYKTNIYNMPLFHFIGCTSSNSTFSIAFGLMLNEQTEAYRWALKTIFEWLYPISHYPVLSTDRDLALIAAIAVDYPYYPHLLCKWHIFNAVLAKCRPYFIKSTDPEAVQINQNKEFEEFLQNWQLLVNSYTKKDYESTLADLKAKYHLSYPGMISYLEDIWLTPHKERFIQYWTNQYLHLGHTATSRVEGSHAYIKGYIKSSKCDILTLWSRIRRGIESQLEKLASQPSKDRMNMPIFTINHGTLYRQLIRKISHHAFIKMDEQRRKAQRCTAEAPLSPCTFVFTRITGLPCAHQIKEWLDANQPIPLSAIHPFWIIDSGSANESLPLYEPRIIESNTQKRVKRANEINIPAAICTAALAASAGQKRKKGISHCSLCKSTEHQAPWHNNN